MGAIRANIQEHSFGFAAEDPAGAVEGHRLRWLCDTLWSDQGWRSGDGVEGIEGSFLGAGAAVCRHGALPETT